MEGRKRRNQERTQGYLVVCWCCGGRGRNAERKGRKFTASLKASVTVPAPNSPTLSPRAGTLQDGALIGKALADDQLGLQGTLVVLGVGSGLGQGQGRGQTSPELWSVVSVRRRRTRAPNPFSN